MASASWNKESFISVENEANTKVSSIFLNTEALVERGGRLKSGGGTPPYLSYVWFQNEDLLRRGWAKSSIFLDKASAARCRRAAIQTLGWYKRLHDTFQSSWSLWKKNSTRLKHKIKKQTNDSRESKNESKTETALNHWVIQISLFVSILYSIYWRQERHDLMGMSGTLLY